MFADFYYFLVGVGLGVTVSFGACFVACIAYSRMSGRPGPTGHVARTEALPFILKDDRAEARIEREASEAFARDQVDGLGR